MAVSVTGPRAVNELGGQVIQGNKNRGVPRIHPCAVVLILQWEYDKTLRTTHNFKLKFP